MSDAGERDKPILRDPTIPPNLRELVDQCELPRLPGPAEEPELYDAAAHLKALDQEVVEEAPDPSRGIGEVAEYAAAEVAPASAGTMEAERIEIGAVKAAVSETSVGAHGTIRTMAVPDANRAAVDPGLGSRTVTVSETGVPGANRAPVDPVRKATPPDRPQSTRGENFISANSFPAEPLPDLEDADALVTPPAGATDEGSDPAPRPEDLPGVAMAWRSWAVAGVIALGIVALLIGLEVASKSSAKDALPTASSAPVAAATMIPTASAAPAPASPAPSVAPSAAVPTTSPEPPPKSAGTSVPTTKAVSPRSKPPASSPASPPQTPDPLDPKF